MKRIVLFVEGEGEADAVPNLVSRLLAEQEAWDSVFVDPNPFRVGHINKLLKDECHEWKRKLGACVKRSNVGGVLLVLDGDISKIHQESFCAAGVAQSLAEVAREVGAGSKFSVAVVFARQEFESWLIAGIESLAGKPFPDGRIPIPSGTPAPEGDVEESPRDAKGWLSQIIEGGYKPTRDQAPLTTLLDLGSLRERNLRSFRRLESAVEQLVFAIRTEQHTATPQTADDESSK